MFNKVLIDFVTEVPTPIKIFFIDLWTAYGFY